MLPVPALTVLTKLAPSMAVLTVRPVFERILNVVGYLRITTPEPPAPLPNGFDPL
jgi:hypothetical protein